MQKDVDTFWTQVDKRIDQIGITSFRELEKQSGFSPGAIGKRKNQSKLPTVEMAQGMCRALRISWIELWEWAGFIDSVNQNLLIGLDAEIHQLLQQTGDDFKRAVLKTIRTWLILYEELRSKK